MPETDHRQGGDAEGCAEKAELGEDTAPRAVIGLVEGGNFGKKLGKFVSW